MYSVIKHSAVLDAPAINVVIYIMEWKSLLLLFYCQHCFYLQETIASYVIK